MQRSVNRAAKAGSEYDIYRHNPWRKPGSAPVADACGLAGGTPWDADAPEEGRYLNTTFAHHGMKGSELPELPTGVVWTPGEEVEVSWQTRFNHGGGYGYRLCPAAERLTESCFQRNHLDFVRDKQALVMADGSRVPINGTFVDQGTSPRGSTWAMVPVPSVGLGPRCSCSPDLDYKPANFDCGCKVGEEAMSCNTPGNCSNGDCLTCPGTPGSDCSRCDNHGGMVHAPPCDGCEWRTAAILDALTVPTDLKPGKYVLGFRYDSEATAQVWASCADIEIGAPAPAPTPAPAPASTSTSATTEAAAAGCTDAADCGYNGKCDADGTCKCEAPWKGPECQVLDLQDAAPGLHENLTSTWGGSVLHGDDGRVYMYAAEMVGGCGINSWTRNSRVIAASADNLSMPFKFERELFGVFSHEPAAVRAPTGEYVLFFTTTTEGCGSYGACVPASICAGMGNGSTCNPGGPACWTQCDGKSGTPRECDDAKTEASPLARFPTYMTWASKPLGPFSTPVMVYNGSDGGGSLPGYPFPPATGDTNMAGVIFDDGSLVGMWRGDRKSFDVKPNVIQYEFTVTAAHWKDPSSYKWGHATSESNIFPSLVDPNGTRTCGIEDPILWLDANGIVHAVVHNWRAGGHAASADRGKSWRWYGGKCSAAKGSSSIDWSRSVWPQTFAFKGEGGKQQTPRRRERPHIVINPKTKRVVALTNSLQLGGADTTQTLVQEVAVSGGSNS